ncbi:MAG: rod shape-determining protein MreC [Gemmatimonadales bacterium]
MRGAAEREAARSDLLLFAGCVALALLALALPRSWTLAFADAVRRTALRPVVALQSRAVQDRIARFRITSIERSRDSLALLVQAQVSLQRENDNLRALLALRPRLAHRAAIAEVLHQPGLTDSRMMLLDVGSADQVKMFDPVVAPAGLIGYVVGVGPHSSTALTWDHPDFAASAVTADGRVNGFVRPASHAGLRSTILELQGVALSDSLRAGTTVMTAGAGGTFPRGIPIGRVVSARRGANGYDRIYQVVPFATPGDVGDVMVLISPRDSLFPAVRGKADGR